MIDTICYSLNCSEVQAVGKAIQVDIARNMLQFFFIKHRMSGHEVQPVL